MTDTLEQRCIDTIRALAMDVVEKAKSGHPGLPMGASAIAYTLWTRHMRYNPRDPHWPNRDRFVLSAGHGSALLYIMLYLTGYDLPMSELQRFRQLHSKTPGHPEYRDTPGVEVTTGPLGQGFANAVGMAIAKRYRAARYNTEQDRVIDHDIYVLCSDGDMMEGVASESASLAGHLQLGELIYLYDDNHVSLDGPTEDTFTEDVTKRFDAYGWHTQRVDGTDVKAIDEAITKAKQDKRPSLIACRTHIGWGSPNKQDTAKAHGSPLGADEVRATKERIGWPVEPAFLIPDDVLAHYRQAGARGEQTEREWQQLRDAWKQANPEKARLWDADERNELPPGWRDALPKFEAGTQESTRVASGKAINALAPIVTNLVGGSADLKSSNETYIEGEGYFSGDKPNRNIAFGVREHAMCSALNGMSIYGGLHVYGGTFLTFSDYGRPAIRLASLMQIPVTYVFTHDSIGLGEDGPTHQPVEHLMALRAIPHLYVVRPGDANETSHAWRIALEHSNGPTLMALRRQKLPIYAETAGDGALRGGYVLRDADPSTTPEVILIGTGSELQLAVQAGEQLAKEGVKARVVSMPCFELFDAQDEAYRESVLPRTVHARVSVEAGITFGWQRYLGDSGVAVGIDRFGASAPAPDLYEFFGFTVDHVVGAAREVMGRLHAGATS
ncbi:MAG TPA: transketolase [Candidatus Angelobacter sp.]|nr:transketolase [Candidatus Angelobacter sp.]